MDSVVIDTSVLINALIGKKGPAREVLRQCLLGNMTPIVSTALFLAYEAVSQRQKIKDLCPLTENEIKQFLAAFFSVCEWVQIHFLWRPNLREENDNFLIELAVAGNADVIVTNKKDWKFWKNLTNTSAVNGHKGPGVQAVSFFNPFVSYFARL